MVVYLDVTINGSGSPINVSDNLSFSFSMDNLEFEAIYGDLKYQQFDLGSVPLEIDIFKNSEFTQGDLLDFKNLEYTDLAKKIIFDTRCCGKS